MKPREIERRFPEPDHAEITLHLNPTLFWFQGHFAVQPLLPGVAQLDWVMHYATTLLAPGFRFHSMPNVKFQAPLLPDNIVTLALHWQADRGTLAFRFERHDGDARAVASSGKIKLCP